LLRFP